MPNKALNMLPQGGRYHRSLGGLCVLWAWLVFACMAAFSGLPAQAATGERVALLIGNARYSSGLPPLLNPPQDVAALEASLKKLGFRVQVLKDGDQKAMGRAIKQFGTQAQEAQVAFFYYSGHGMQAREENYLIPVGAGIESEADLDIEAVALRSLMRQIDEARPHNAVVVLDACRDNPVAARTKSASKGLSRINSQPTNTLVVFAALAGNTASDNGVFAKALATHITQPNLGLRGVFDNVNKAVRQASGNKQSIQRDDQLSEDVVLLASVRPESNPNPNPLYRLSGPGATQGGGLSLDDLEREDAMRKEWAQWQTRMKADFDRTVAFKGSADLQAKAWELFLATWGQDNPLSMEDDGLRAQAQGQLQEMQRQLHVVAPTPIQVTRSNLSITENSETFQFSWPAAGNVITSFDEQKNKGVGIGGKAGDAVSAAADGRVVYAGSGLRGYGNLVILKHNNTFMTAYAHNRALLVSEDQNVKQGQTIAEMGDSDSNIVKLHFEIRRHGKAVDPIPYLPIR